ncbi:MAG TPA: hypothetical protein VHY48_04065 [Acidobacteriaceae bacterium]|nr:hypothetical protein [Acidobacteriaceae bacterium]
MTVAQLQQVLATAHGVTDKKLVTRIDNIRLTERLSDSTLALLLRSLPGPNSRETLQGLAAESAYLDPPPVEIPSRVVPDPAAQGVILARLANYLQNVVPGVPGLMATQRAVYYGGPATVNLLDHESLVFYGDLPVGLNRDLPVELDENSWNEPRAGELLWPWEYLYYSRLKYLGTSSTEVFYRDGQEYTLADEKGEAFELGNASLGLAGVFGTVLAPLPAVVSAGKMVWSHWEQGPHGPLAAFRYERTEPRTWYDNSNLYNGMMKRQSTVSHIYGEIVVNPSDGSILRLVEIARTPGIYADLFPFRHPDPEKPISEMRNVIEYASIDVGGVRYLCPVRRIVTSLYPIVATPAQLNEPDYLKVSLSESPLFGVQPSAVVTFSGYRLWTPAPLRKKRGLRAANAKISP